MRRSSYSVRAPWAEVKLEDGVFAYTSSYDADLVDALKQTIPPGHRRWDKERKAWMINPAYGLALARATKEYLDIDLELPAAAQASDNNLQEETLEIHYLGSTKDKPGVNEPQAMGYSNGEWSVVIPESVLRKFFSDNTTRPGDASTFYGVLGLAKSADAQEVKKNYRRLALQWHPDHCREDGASEQFQRIKKAYEVLSDAQFRAKYDAGLALASQVGHGDSVGRDGKWGYRAPLRCGLVRVRAHRLLGRANVSEILSWDDIINPQGQTLVVSWPRGAEKFTEVWI